MPSFFFTFKKFLLLKSLNEQKYNKMTFSLATPNLAGYSYLNLFKEEFHPEMAEICKESLTVKRVVEIVVQNLNYDMLYSKKVKPTRFDDMKLFNIEREDEDEWENTSGQEWFKVKELLFFIGRNFKDYKFM